MKRRGFFGALAGVIAGAAVADKVDLAVPKQAELPIVPPVNIPFSSPYSNTINPYIAYSDCTVTCEMVISFTKERKP